MKIIAENFGPINKAEIRITPLTVIIGKNNLGKSYLTQLIHVLCSFLIETGFGYLETYPYFWHSRFASPREFLRIRKPYYFHINYTENALKELKRKIRDKNIKDYDIIDILSTKIMKDMSNIVEKQLTNKLEQIFGVRIGNLVSLGTSQSRIDLIFNDYFILRILITNKNRLRVDFVNSSEQKGKFEAKIIPFISQLRKTKRITRIRIYEIIQEFLNLLMISLTDSIYIPAGRAGLLESYDTVVAALVNLSSWAPLHGLTMSPIPGVASQFYNRLLSLEGTKGPFANIADKLKIILSGDIQLRKIRGITSGAPRIYYTFKWKGETRRIEVIHAASMIKELCPLYLIMKEAVNPNSLLIVEEPESHLHPSAQCQLIEIFSTLVSNNVNVILTTHSDLIIRKIGNLIGYSKFKKEQLPQLDLSLVSIHLLKETPLGNVSIEVPIPDDGIFENIPEFDNVINELYEEQLYLQQQAQLGD